MEERRKIKLQAEWRSEYDDHESGRPLGIRGIITLNNTELWRSPTLHTEYESYVDEQALDDAEKHVTKVLKWLLNSMPKGV
jgi:hypothetical protein